MTLHGCPDDKTKMRDLKFDEYLNSSRASRNLQKHIEELLKKEYEKLKGAEEKRELGTVPSRHFYMLDYWFLEYMLESLRDWESAAIPYLQTEGTISVGSETLRYNFTHFALANNFYYYANPKLCPDAKKAQEEGLEIEKLNIPPGEEK